MPNPLTPGSPLPLAVLVRLAAGPRGRSELAERITRALSALGARVVISPDELGPVELGPGESVDLVITDSPAPLAERGLQGDVSTGRPGWIILGGSAPEADVHLPLDFSDRELLLACRLVGEIVRLRRRSLDDQRDRGELARLAAADPLTGLPNRRAWEAEAPARWHRARAAGQAICLAIFDVDRFKAVNDVRGYATGDAVLAAIGQGLAAALRGGDLLARLGGDEFAALLVGSFDPAAALAIVDRVRSAVGAQETQRLGFEVSLSAGCAVETGGSAAEETKEETKGTQLFSEKELRPLFASADAALREAKRAGRDRAILAE